MPKSRSVSGSAFGGTINIDTNYAQELVDFWTQKYERVKEELDRIKDTSVTAYSPPWSSSHDNNDGDESSGNGGPGSSAMEYERESEEDTLRACNEDLRSKLAASEQRRLKLLQEIQAFRAQNEALAFEADISRQQKINSIYPQVAFFPAGATPLTLRFSSPHSISERLPAGITADRRICFLPRPPACLPIRVSACGQHGYWFSPGTTFPEYLEFELVVEGKPNEWTYLGRYKSVHLPGGGMRLSEWLVLDEETKSVHCTRVVTQGPGQDAETPAIVSAAAAEVRQKYESGQAVAPCFTLVCMGFTMTVHAALHDAAAWTRKRKSGGQTEENPGKRVREGRRPHFTAMESPGSFTRERYTISRRTVLSENRLHPNT